MRSPSIVSPPKRRWCPRSPPRAAGIDVTACAPPRATIAAETSQAADTHEVDLRRRLAASADVAGRQAARMLRVVEGFGVGTERRARPLRTRDERIRRERGRPNDYNDEAGRDGRRTRTRDGRARRGAPRRGGGGRGRRRRRCERARRRRRAGSRRRPAVASGAAPRRQLAVLNRVAPWRSKKSPASARERTDASRRATVPRGGGRGDGRGARDAGGIVGGDARGGIARLPPPSRKRAPSARGAERRERAGDVTAVLQRVVPALRRAEKTLEEAEECRSAFPRVARVRCTAGGTSNSRLSIRRGAKIALNGAAGAYRGEDSRRA